MAQWLAANWNLVIGLTMTFAAVFVLPLALFVHRMIKADVLQKAKEEAAALAKSHLDEYAKHRVEIVGKLATLENGHANLVRDVHEVKALASVLDAKADEHAKQLAFVNGSLEAIKQGLNGFMKERK